MPMLWNECQMAVPFSLLLETTDTDTNSFTFARDFIKAYNFCCCRSNTTDLFLTQKCFWSHSACLDHSKKSWSHDVTCVGKEGYDSLLFLTFFHTWKQAQDRKNNTWQRNLSGNTKHLSI
jgi:hypothetical protein